MRFSELLIASGVEPIAVRGDAPIGDIAFDSRRCGQGTCFVAVRGSAQDGHRFIDHAVRAGAAAVVCEEPLDVPQQVALAVVPDSRLALGRLAHALVGWPGRQMTTIGVTGTNGKTTVACLLRTILRRAGLSAGMLGTVCYDIGRETLPASTTTPDPVSLATMLARMRQGGCTHLVMEVSSHALHQDRVAGLDLQVGIFTNLTGDHLDYHGSMHEYCSAKRRMFEQLPPSATAVINRDDPSADAMASAVRGDVIHYGLSPLSALRARLQHADAGGSAFDLLWQGRELAVCTPLIGRHNVYNALAAAGACLALGMDLDEVANSLHEVDSVPGRLERVHTSMGFSVFVDYAHTDDALANVLRSLRPITRRRLWVVFGCGGDRDRTKRPRMGRLAEQLADHVILTSDNPRSEDPRVILHDIEAGMTPQGRQKTQVQPDRRAAIELALRGAAGGDVVLIAGKGHETYQQVGPERLEFNDHAVAAEVLRALEAEA